MNKIILIGCPGSGKSTLSFKMEEILKYPVLHLDKIYHIDNEKHITRDELKQQVFEFASKYDKWIIDGNYMSTLDQRIGLCDTIIYLDFPTEVCVQNVIDRSKKERTKDMAEGFNNSKLNQEFVDWVQKFNNEQRPIIYEKLQDVKNKKIIILKNYTGVDNVIRTIKNN